MSGGKRKKRFWSEEEKRSICQQARVDGVLLPVELPELGIVASPCVPDLPASCDPTFSSSGVLAQRFEITLSDGRRILVEGPTELDAVIGMVKGLAS